MVARVRALQGRLLPQGWLDVLRQVALFGAAYLAYRLVRGLVEGDANAAFAHARELISLERTLHVFVEPSVQAWASGSRLLMEVSSWLYVNAQTTVTVGALVYLYLRHNRNFYFVRNMFMIAMAIALVGYTVFPTAPPRFMPEWGFIDSVSDFTGLPGLARQRIHDRAVQPLCRGALDARRVRADDRLAARPAGAPGIVKVLWLLYPFLMAFVIVATANHFIVDAMLGAVTAGLSAYGARGSRA